MRGRYHLFCRRMASVGITVLILSAVTACGARTPQGTDSLDLSKPGSFEFGGTDVKVEFDSGFDETIVGADGSTVERKALYSDGLLTFTAYDTNRDGKDDLWFQYDDELHLKVEMRDTNGDGKPDRLIYYDKDEKVIREETR